MFDLTFSLIYLFILSVNLGIIVFNVSSMKITKQSIIILTIIMFAVFFLSNNYHKDQLIVPITTIIIFIYLCLLFKKKYYALLTTLYAQLIFAFGDSIAGAILLFIFRIKYYDIVNDPKIKLITAFLILIVCYFLSRVSRRIIKNNYLMKQIKINAKKVSLLGSSLIVALICLYSYAISLKAIFNNGDKGLISVNLFFIFSFFTLIFILTYLNYKNIKKDLEQEFTNKELAQFKQHASVLEDLSNDLRSFRHDYFNILQTIGEYIKLKNMDGLEEFYYKELMPESKKILERNRSYTLLDQIKIDSLKGLLSSKIISAQTKNINVSIEITETINGLQINILDICRIIGILFDNAIEATILCENKAIKFIVIKNNDSTSFIINNTCLENTPPIHKIYERNFSTKGINRGIGLKTIKNILIERYNNVTLNTSINDCIFTQELIIIDN